MNKNELLKMSTVALEELEKDIDDILWCRQKTEVWLRKILEDKELSQLHDLAICLWWNIRCKRFPEARYKEAAYNLADTHPPIGDFESMKKYEEEMPRNQYNWFVSIVDHPQFDLTDFVFSFTHYNVCNNGLYNTVS